MSSDHELLAADSFPRGNASDKQPGKDEEIIVTNMDTTAQQDKPYLQGPRLWLVASTLAVMVFLIVLEIPIVPTCLVSISNDIGGFDMLSWVISSYLLGRIGVMVIFAKLSDILGRKFIFTTSIAIFAIFSGACGGAQTMTQLIVFRAFQGVGGGGAYSLSTVLITELVPPHKIAKSTAQLSLVTTLGNVLGPIIGGAISNNTNWRWIFWLNVPIAVCTLLLALAVIPNGFPHHNETPRQLETQKPRPTASIKRLDIIGTILLLVATVSLAAGFQEAGSRFPWKSAYVISLLTISGLLWIVLLLWERRVTLAGGSQEPVLPWRLLTDRAMTGILLIFFMVGGPLVVTIYQIPQFFQLVYGLSGLDAGVRVVPFTALWSVGLIISPTLAGKLKVPPIYIILVGSSIQVIGFALLGTLPVSLQIPPQIYAYEVIAGLGCGLVFPLLFIMIPFVAQKRDRAVGMATGSQFQVMGSAIVLSIATSIFNSYTRDRLTTLLGASGSLLNLGESLASIPTQAQEQARLTLAEGYNRQSLVLCATAAFQMPLALLLWKRKQVTV
ncbi:putative multidrug resistance protein fnx1 [Annulohypoxylon bovei var. microspora]|nr:putative multidrug resistance protein fnx1 [Annulohypoxylon bovei var. microspora]